ncbi:Rap1a/Tai family immunity protein [Arenimonas sp. MALMAid1274]|uniref:Rap1a/Tai family immunity protein n=1 Tax=Arenimonas sp. MALMAid1274 TaxID=3411630 RepID=UPI003BA260E1
MEEFCSGLSGSAQTSSQLSCAAYVAGFRSGYNMNAWALPFEAVCWPDKADNVQLARVFLKWAAENPAKGHEDAASDLLSALSAAYPCPDK